MRYNAAIMILLKRLLLVTALLIPLVNASSFSWLESTSNGRLGIAAINTANNEEIVYRTDERFPFCSTSKLIVVAAILAKSTKNPDLLDEIIHYTQRDIDDSGYAPITRKHHEMTVRALCEVAMDYSDNTAMNLLINVLGGTKAVNVYARSIRAGVDKSWIIGDKTGGGAYGTNNDIAILFPPHCAPIVMVIYFTQNKQNSTRDDKVIASATRLVISEFAKNDTCLGKSY
jgi:beta-lactamase class A